MYTSHRNGVQCGNAIQSWNFTTVFAVFTLYVPLCIITLSVYKALSYLRPSVSAGLVLPFAISVDDLDNFSLVSSMMDELEIFGCVST